MLMYLLGGAVVLLIGFGIFMLVVDPEEDPKDDGPQNG